MKKSRIALIGFAVLLVVLAGLFAWQASVLAEPLTAPQGSNPNAPLANPQPLSSYQRIQNLDPVAANTVTVTVYTTGGAVQGSAVTGSNSNFSTLVDQRSCCSVGSGFAGSGVVNATTDIAAVTFLVSGGAGTSSFRSDAYLAVPGPSAYAGTQLIPQVYRGVPYRGQTFTSTVAIQNAGSSAADVYFTYFPYSAIPCPSGSSLAFVRSSIAPNATTYLDLASTGNATLDACSMLYGSLAISGTQPLAIVSNGNMDAGLASHTGFIPDVGPAPVDAGTTVVVPQAFKYFLYNGLRYSAGIQVMTQNLVTATITTTLHTLCSSQNVCAGGPDIVFTRVANPAYPVDLALIPELASYSAWYGSAEISSSVPIVALVNDVTDPTNNNVFYGYTSAKAFTRSAGTSTMYVPHIVKNEAYPAADGLTWSAAGINVVANQTGVFSGQVYCTYYVDNPGGNPNKQTRVQPISNTGPAVVCDPGLDPTLSSYPNLHGSAVVTATNGIRIVGTVTQVGPGTGDAYMTYSTINR